MSFLKFVICDVWKESVYFQTSMIIEKGKVIGVRGVLDKRKLCVCVTSEIGAALRLG